ncbi:MAG: AI-2E family transporter [Planctomycetota bacterium]|nr:MAG: AI-2E family transporter [Planctomycetota bacterium]
MLERLSPTRRNLALLVLFALVLWFAWTIRAVLNPLLLGYLCAYILHPLVVRLEARGFKRRTAVNLIFLVGFLGCGLLALGLWTQGRSLARDVLQNATLADQLKGQFESAKTAIDAWLGKISPTLALPDWPTVKHWFDDLVRNFGQDKEQAAKVSGAGLAAAGSAGTWLIAFFGDVLAFLLLLLLVPIYAYFLLFELKRVNAFVARYLPRSEKVRILRIGDQIGQMLASFFRGRLLVCLIKGVFLALGMWMCGLPYALLFGLGSGFLGLVPFVGAFAGFVGALLVSTIDGGLVPALWKCGLVFGLAEILEGYVLLPKILGDSLGLHPIIVLFALMAGGVAFGFFGVLIALPLTASVVILVRELVLPALSRMAEESPIHRGSG